MKSVIVTGSVPGIGVRSHHMRAANKAEAWAKFCRAYGGRDCAFISLVDASTRAPVWSGGRK